jgi:hypothetical protein
VIPKEMMDQYMEEMTLLSPFRKMLGYTKHPFKCTHDHKRFITCWVCVDCGEKL